MHSLRDLLAFSVDLLKRAGIDQPRRQAEELLCDALRMTPSQFAFQFDKPLSAEEIAHCQTWLERRAKGEPLAYISGRIDFYCCDIQVTPAVLIPRQETEILVDKIVQTLAKRPLKGKCLWDLCCGSGCIGISLKKRFPQLQVIAADLSVEALAVATGNAQRNGVAIEFVQGDLLYPFEGKKADVVVCNPPYIAEREYGQLESEVRLYEPRGALVAGMRGTEFYERLARELPAYLNPSALVWFEIGYQQGERVLELFCSHPWKRKLVEKDWAGHDRFFFLENE